MTKFQHTETPFVAVKAPTNDFGFRWEIMHGDSNVAILSTRPEAEANAKFIVTACNNHNALISALALVNAELRFLKFHGKFSPLTDKRIEISNKVLADIREADNG